MTGKLTKSLSDFKKMKNNRFLVSATILGITALTFTSCTKAPQEKIDLANQAVQNAATLEAEVYATYNFVALQDSLKGALEAVEAENGSFIKDYSVAVEKLDQVIILANDVKVEAEIGKQAYSAEIAANIQTIQTLLAENKQLIEEAPKGKEGATALMAIKGELEAIEVAVAELNNLVASGDLISSSQKAKVSKEKATLINSELKEVIAKYKGTTRRV